MAAALVVLLGLTAATLAILGFTTAVLAAQIGPVISQAIAGITAISAEVDGGLDALVEFVVTIGTALLQLSTNVIGGHRRHHVRDRPDPRARLLHAPRRRHRLAVPDPLAVAMAPRRADQGGDRLVTVTGEYMSGTAVLAIFGAVTQLVIMVILGIPLALPLAVLTFFGGFIPIVGSMITTGIAFLVTVAYGEPSDIVIMFVYTIVFNIVQGNVLQPIVYGKAASLHPAVVLLAIPAGQAIAGVLGMFLIVPVLGIIAIAGSRLLHTFDAEPRASEPALIAAPTPMPPPESEPVPAT